VELLLQERADPDLTNPLDFTQSRTECDPVQKLQDFCVGINRLIPAGLRGLSVGRPSVSPGSAVGRWKLAHHQ
jgi:hypothetical protein